jgi:membrane-associated phospholipid phosphatase
VTGVEAAGPLAVHGVFDALRKTGAVGTVRDAMTPTTDAVAFAVTNLGDTAVLLVALTLFFWYASEREDGALAVALALGALALVTFLKHLFGLPRPPAALQAYPADGLGFPSGHALGSTVAWGAMAYLGDRWDRRRGLAVAAPLVVAIGFSRVVLGVHYLGSVLAGFAIGLVFLVVMLRVAHEEPVRAFAVAAALAVLAAASGAVADGATALGGVAGGAVVVWHLDLEGSVHPAVAVAGLVVFGGIFVGTLSLEPPWPALLLANGVVVGGLFAVPVIEREARSRAG